MKVGILESRNDTFINDVLSNLSEVEVEFLSFRQQVAPISGDYRVIVDRASFCHTFLKETMKNLALSGTYIINNPFSATATNKLIDIRVGSSLGISLPKTFALPGANLTDETEEWIGEPVWEQIIDEVGLACIPKPLSMGKYLYSDLNPIENMKDTLTKLTIDLNTCLDLDVNAVEWCIDEEGHPWLIDAFNEVPEIKKEALPEEYYNWIVQKFVECIEDKLDSNKRNKTVFLLKDELNDKVFRIYPPPQMDT